MEKIAESSNLDLPEIVENKVQQEEITAVEEVNEGPKACEDSRFIRFFKMVQFGVPLGAVKQKMASEGLDPNVLE